MSTDTRQEPRRSVDVDINPMQMDHIGYVQEYSFFQDQRRKLRLIMDSLLFESFTIVIVLVYAVILFIDMTASSTNSPDPAKCQHSALTPDLLREAASLAGNTSLLDDCNLREQRDVLYFLDLIFLSIFMFEIALRLIGFGLAFLKEAIQAIDCAVVTVAFISSALPPEVCTRQWVGTAWAGAHAALRTRARARGVASGVGRADAAAPRV